MTRKRKRSQGSRSPSSSPPLESSSKRRGTDNVIKDAGPTARVQTPREKSDVTSSDSQNCPLELFSSSTLKSNDPHQKSSPSTYPADTATSTPSRRNTFVLPNFSTPRKPLSDLSVQSSRRTPAHGGPLNSLVFGNSVYRSNTISRPSPPVLLDIKPTAARPPSMLRAHASILNNTRNKPALNRSTTSGPMNPFHLNDSDILTRSTFQGRDISTAYKASSLSLAPAPFPPSRMNHSAEGTDDPQGGATAISQNKPATSDTATNVQMLPPNLPFESSAIARVKGDVVPTAVALGNMKATPVSWIIFPSFGLCVISFWTCAEDWKKVHSIG